MKVATPISVVSTRLFIRPHSDLRETDAVLDRYHRNRHIRPAACIGDVATRRAAVRYAADYSGTKVAAGIAYSYFSPISSTVDDQVSGSGSVIMGNGLNFTAAGGFRSLKRSGDDASYFYTKLGYQASFFEVGKTPFSIEFGREYDLAADGDEATVYGIGVNQLLEKWGTEVYAGFRLYVLDRSGVSFDDIAIGMVGSRVTF